jgi:hypothetical protein
MTSSFLILFFQKSLTYLSFFKKRAVILHNVSSIFARQKGRYREKSGEYSSNRLSGKVHILIIPIAFSHQIKDKNN